jgi:hypothetical protein
VLPDYPTGQAVGIFNVWDNHSPDSQNTKVQRRTKKRHRPREGKILLGDGKSYNAFYASVSLSIGLLRERGDEDAWRIGIDY